MGWFSKRKERPDARDAAIRAIVLRHVVSYAAMMPTGDAVSQAAMWWTDAEKREFTKDSKRTRDNHWDALGAYRKNLSPLELSFSRATLETINDQQLIDASWRMESLVVLLWALGTIEELPPFDHQSLPAELGDFLTVPADEFVGRAELRYAEEMERERQFAESWHWRSRTRGMVEEGAKFPDDPQLAAAGFTSFDSIVRHSALLHADDGTFDRMIDEDYPAFGKAYRDLTSEEWSIVRSITAERHFALNWLCGYARGHRWDETPTNT